VRLVPEYQKVNQRAGKVGAKKTKLDEHRPQIRQIIKFFEIGNQYVIHTRDKTPHKKQGGQGCKWNPVTFFIR
jgi:hypothetical protein